jgi:hypothetical protein
MMFTWSLFARLCVLFALSASVAKAELQETWRVVFTNLTASKVASDSSNNLIILSPTVLSTNGDAKYNAVVSKVGTNGAVLWRTFLNNFTPRSSGEQDFVVDRSGNTYLTGGRLGTVVLQKLNPQGVPEWAINDPLQTNRSPFLAIDSIGNIALAGLDGSTSCSVAKFSPSGNRLLSTNYPLSNSPFLSFWAFYLDAADNFIFINQSGVVAQTNPASITKLSPEGHLLWNQALPTAEVPNLLVDYKVGAEGSLYLSSWSGVTKLTADGHLAWTATNTGRVLLAYPDGSILTRQATIDHPPELQKLSPTGQLMWRIPEPSGEKTFACAATSGGNLILPMVSYVSSGLRVQFASLNADKEFLWSSGTFSSQEFSWEPLFLGMPDGTIRLTGTDLHIYENYSTTFALQSVSVDGAPRILSHPQSATAIWGRPFQFSVTASGKEPLHYSLFNGTNLLSAGYSNAFVHTPYSPSDNYYILVTNTLGKAWTHFASLQVIIPPYSYPDYREAFSCINATIPLHANANGSEPLSYQWAHDGALLQNQTNEVLVLPSLQAGSAGFYSVIVSNAGGTITNLIRLTIAPSLREDWRSVQDPGSLEGFYAQIALSNETRYVAFQNEIRSFSDNGNILWKTNGSFKSVVSDGLGGFVVLTPEGLERFSTQGKSLWQKSLAARSVFVKDNLIYTAQDAIRIFDLSGNAVDSWAPQCEDCSGFTIDQFQRAADGGLLCSGFTSDHELGVAKFNQLGQTRWIARTGIWPDLYSGRRYDVVAVSDGRIAVGGVTDSNNVSLETTLVLDGNGQEVWRTTQEKPHYFNELHLAIGPSNSLFTAYRSEVTKYSLAGERLWSAPLGHPAADTYVFICMTVDAQGFLYVVGSNESESFLQKFSSKGDSIAISGLFFNFRPASASLALTDALDLYVAASGSGGTALLKLIQTISPNAPTITDGPNPAHSIAIIGNSLTLTATFDGATPMSFRWIRQGKFYGVHEIPGATNATLTITNLDWDDAGDYYVEVRNAFGIVSSRAAAVVVGTIPYFDIGEVDQYVYPVAPELVQVNQGGSLVLDALDSGFSPVEQWQWFLNDLPIAGATSSQLHLANVEANQASVITLFGSNTFGVHSVSVPLFVNTNLTVAFEVSIDAGPVLNYFDMSPHLAVNAQDETFLLGVMGPLDFASNNPRWFLHKYSPTGDLLWSLEDELSYLSAVGPALELDSAGNLFLTYNVLSPEWQSGVMVKKIAANGSVLWHTNLAAEGSTYREMVASGINAAGEMFIMGMEAPPDRSSSLIFITKLNADGSMAWSTNRLGYASALATTPDGGVGLVVNESITKLGPDGAELWTRGSNLFSFYADPIGNLYAAGEGIIKVAPDGAVQWWRPDTGINPRATSNSLLLVIDGGLAKFSAVGEQLWNSSIAGVVYMLGPQDEAYVSGGSQSVLWTRKLDPLGSQVWVAKSSLGTNWQNHGNAIALSSNGDVTTAHLLVNTTNNEARYLVTRYKQNTNDTAPAVYVTPAIASITFGQEHCFTGHVTTAENYHLQWFKDGFVLEGQTNLNLCLPGNYTSYGSYQLVVSTPSSIIRSANNELQLRLPSIFPVATPTPGSLSFLAFPKNSIYPIQIQSSTNLIDWKSLSEMPPGYIYFSVPVGHGEAHFFRAVQQLP